MPEPLIEVEDLGVTHPAPGGRLDRGGGAVSEPIVEVEDLSVTFPTDDGDVYAVRNVSFDLYEGEVLGIVGESGSGKSVTNLAMMGLLPESARVEGSVRFRGEELLGLSERQLEKIRGSRVAMIFQDPMTSLNPVYTVGDQISEVLQIHEGLSRKAGLERAVELLDEVGIPNPRARVDSYPHEFSGGMRQRAMIAMAIATRPDVLIADEPTTALDVTIQAQVLDVLDRIQQSTGTAVILITHDLGVVARSAARVMVMYAGRAVEYGDIGDIFDEPAHPYTVGLLRSLPRLDSDEPLVPIPGSPPGLIHLPPGCAFSRRCVLARDRCEVDQPQLRLIGRRSQLTSCHFAEELVGG